MGLTPSTITETKKQGLSLIIAAGEHCYLDYPQLPGQNNRGWMPTPPRWNKATGWTPPTADQKRKQTISSAFRAPCGGEHLPFPEPHSLPRLSACLRHCGSRLVTDERALLGKTSGASWPTTVNSSSNASIMIWSAPKKTNRLSNNPPSLFP